MTAIQHLIDCAHGVYVPQAFAENADLRRRFGYGENDADIKILLAGPDDEWYWEAWEAVLNNAKDLNGYTLHQDGDLWALKIDAMTDAEYEGFFEEPRSE